MWQTQYLEPKLNKSLAKKLYFFVVYTTYLSKNHLFNNFLDKIWKNKKIDNMKKT